MIIISHPQLHVYGVGQTPSEALADFMSMLIDLYKELADSENTLSCHLREQLGLLRDEFVELLTAETIE